MRRLVTTLAVVLLACVGTVPLSCQKPSPPMPPPWLGGERVEMPEHGFALTVPEGWVAFDTAVDAVSQLEAAAGYVDPDVWSPDDADDVDLLTGAVSSTSRLMLVDGRNACAVNSEHGAPTAPDVTADEFASALATVTDVQPPERVDLPAGPAYVIRHGVSEPGEVLQVSLLQGSTFVLGEQGSVVLTVACSNLFTRTDDLWLSIAESIEFLPEN